MKVSLDACLFGAVCDVTRRQHILDIGTGTGLLALMIAQRSQASIDAVELEQAAAQQAQSNFQNSIFHSQLTLHHTSIQDFQSEQPYDCIVCNPPFFTDHLQSDNAQRNQARHNDGLSFADLAKHMARLLRGDGAIWLLLPPHEQQNFQPHAQTHGLHLQQHVEIRSRENKPSKMGIWHYALQPVQTTGRQVITIYQPNSNEYTTEFTHLLADYYLKL